MRFNIINAKIVTLDSVIENGTLEIEDKNIIGIREKEEIESGKEIETAKSDGVLDAAGKYVLPGIIDIHGDDLEGVISPRPSTRFPIELALLQADRKYVAWGITTKLHALSYYDDELKDRHAGASIEIMEALECIEDKLLTEHFIHVRCEIGHEMKDAFEAIENRFVKLVSVMDHAPGQGQFNDPAKYIEFHKGAYNLSDEFLEKLMKKKMDLSFSDLKLEKIREVARRARDRNLLLASHDDDSPEHVEFLHSLGACLSEFPINLEAAKRAKELGMIISMGAPNLILGRSTANNLSCREAIKAGAVDVLCSDYYPTSLLYSAFLLQKLELLPFPEAVKMITLNAAKVMSMEESIGSIEVGKRANLIIVSEKDGMPVVSNTIVNGRLVYSAGG
ncbi:MAG: alpha-D-ribose 1-methylphosphonate 5-triphosphate diphosphatase [Methanosarcina sp.]